MLFFIVIAALLIDRLLGEPTRYHPLVGFGWLANTIERWLNQSRNQQQEQNQEQNQEKARAIARGVLGYALLIAPLTWLTYLISSHLGNHAHYLSWLFDIIVLYWAIGHQSLNQHINNISNALINKDLPLAQQRVSLVVSRDTTSMNQEQIINASIETTLENGNDATFAPLFWYCCLGAPAVVLFRLSNTLDAMWGYRNDRFELFGKCAARIDDVLNYLPARLVALSFIALGNIQQAMASWKQHAKLLSSPNASVVMTSGAGSLNIKLGGPAIYHGQPVDKPYFGGSQMARVNDIARALRLISHSLILWCTAIAAIAAFQYLNNHV